jgi:lysosomal Pro-X carboxypeptidase
LEVSSNFVTGKSPSVISVYSRSLIVSFLFPSCLFRVLYLIMVSSDFFPASPWNYTALEEYCQYAWGVTPDASWASTFGYNSLEGVTNIIFSNGMLDPWRGGGVQVTSDLTLPALIVEGGAHHLDLRTPNPLDPESVVEVREKEIAFLQSWISDYYAAMN